MRSTSYSPNTIRFGRTMIEFYAKIVPMSKGMFNYQSTVWKSHNGIESIWNTKKFFKINSARIWSEKIITEAIAKENRAVFIKELDVIRRKWNEQ